jgi:hypothetical protein
MTHSTLFFMLFEAVTFMAAALVHAGVLVDGYEHREARIAESVIAAVLLLGSTLAGLRPQWTRAAGLAAQGFALLGTLVGIVTIAVGIGPRTAPDVVYHAGIVIVLVFGLAAAARARGRVTPPPRFAARRSG